MWSAKVPQKISDLLSVFHGYLLRQHNNVSSSDDITERPCPDTCHHATSAPTQTSEARSINEENKARLGAMSEEQILEEQKKLLQTLGDQ